MNLFFLGVVLACAVGTFVSIFLRGLVDKEYDSLTEWEKTIDLKTIRSKVPDSSYQGQYFFGRFRRPIPDMNLHSLTTSQKIAQKKEFVWTAVSDGEWFIGCALLQFSYSTGAIVYAYNSRLNESHVTHLEAPIVTALGAKFTPSSTTQYSSAVSGCATWDFLGLSASKCFNEESQSFNVSLTGQFKDGKKYAIAYDLDTTEEAMSMVFPLGPKRPSIVTKLGGTRSSATTLAIDGTEPVVLHNALGLMDYTRGLLRRKTLWHWLAVTWVDAPSGARLGLQLSEGVYDNSDGVSMESTLWLNGQAHDVGSKVIYLQQDKTVKPQDSKWTVQTSDGSVELEFTPAGVIVGAFHYGILDGDLFHIWGIYTGFVKFGDRIFEVNHIPGVLEDHYAIW